MLRDIKKYREEKRPTNYKSCIRALLYFLRIREEHRDFLRPDEWPGSRSDEARKIWVQMAGTFYDVDDELSKKFLQEERGMRQLPLFDGIIEEKEHPDFTLLRTAAKKFLNGSGTLEDIVNIMEEE